MEIHGSIGQTFEAQTGIKALSVAKVEKTANNHVFRIETASGPYIFKIYKSCEWPEKGKLRFVSHKLMEYGIPHAEILASVRDDARFPTGYLVEQCLPGITADKLNLTFDETLRLFSTLAPLVARLHRIKLPKYGYIGDTGIGEWTSFSQYMYDSLFDYPSKLVEAGLMEADDFEALGRNIQEKLAPCDIVSPVLSHGDLTRKNMLVHAGKITLIDWDDAHAYCWMDDIARLTFWMKLDYEDGAAKRIREAFLENYDTQEDKRVFYEVEEILQVRQGLDLLTFFAEKPQYRRIEKEINALRKANGL